MKRPLCQDKSPLIGTKANAMMMTTCQKETSMKILLTLMTPHTMFIKALLTSMLKVKAPKSTIFSKEGRCTRVEENTMTTSQLIQWSSDILSLLNVVALLVMKVGSTSCPVSATKRKHSQTLTGPRTITAHLTPLLFLNESDNLLCRSLLYCDSNNLNLRIPRRVIYILE